MMTRRLEALERLARLKASGLLDEEELAAEKARILKEQPAEATEVVRTEKKSAGIIPWLQGHRRKLLLIGVPVTVGVALSAIVLTSPDGLGRAANAELGNEAGPANEAEPDVVRGSDANSDFAAALEGDLADCGFADQLRAVLASGAAEGDAPTQVRVPGLGGPVALARKRIPADGDRPAAAVSEAQLSASWNGLDVTGIRSVVWEPGPATSIQIRFADPVAKVRRQLTEAGLSVGKAGELSKLSGGDKATAVGIEALADGSALSCLRA